MQGSVVFDEVIVPIREIKLAGGHLMIIAQVTGPLAQVRTDRANLYDDEGRLVMAGCRLLTPIEFGPIAPHVQLVVELTVRLTGNDP